MGRLLAPSVLVLVVVAEAELDGVRCSRLRDRVGESGVDDGVVLGMDELKAVASRLFFRRESRMPLAGRRQVAQVQVFIENGDDVGRTLYERAETLFALRYRFFSALALRDIPGAALHAHRFPVPVNVAAADFNRNTAAIHASANAAMAPVKSNAPKRPPNLIGKYIQLPVATMAPIMGNALHCEPRTEQSGAWLLLTHNTTTGCLVQVGAGHRPTASRRKHPLLRLPQ